MRITLEQLIQIYAFSNNDVLEKVDAIVYLEGDSFSRVERCVNLFKKGYAPTLLISGTDNRPHLGCFPAKMVQQKMMELGVPKSKLILEEKSINTRNQAIEILKIAKKRKWKKIILVTSLYHQPRAYLTFVGTMKERGQRLEIINDPVRGLPWFERTPRGTRFNIVQREIRKINLYLKRGHLANFRTILDYQQWKEKRKK